MVKVIFYSLLRSKYNIKEEFVEAGTIDEIINQILERHSNMEKSDFRYGVVLYKGKPIHYYGFDTVIEDNEEIIFTHFVSGG
jgi:molybdopterin converting factor small subunit